MSLFKKRKVIMLNCFNDNEENWAAPTQKEHQELLLAMAERAKRRDNAHFITGHNEPNVYAAIPDPVLGVKVMALKGKYPPEEGDEWSVICCKDEKEVMKWAEFWRGWCEAERTIPYDAEFCDDDSRLWWESLPDKERIEHNMGYELEMLKEFVKDGDGVTPEDIWHFGEVLKQDAVNLLGYKPPGT
jgi:hypothetical protein